MSVVLETSMGDITIDLYVEERPKSCLNFLKLCKMKAFHFNLFHYVQRNFVIQTGDPTGTGRGGESIYKHIYGDQASFVDAEKTPRIKHRRRGTVSFVNNGGDQIGSQFLITAGAGPQQSLDAGGPHGHSGHVVFGEVVDGFDVVDDVNEVYCDPQGRPFKDVRIFHTVVLDDPFDDPEGLSFPDCSPAITAEAVASDRLGVDDDPMDEDGLDESTLNEKFEEKSAKARATVLELVGDIKHVDDAPPENVLFVCKLNPVTTEEDLQIIFSRFGKIEACDIITDKRTGASLQYAFIEFENPVECERAYFKMDNVLIDDRRIHVDFSQSVAKNKWLQLREEKRRKKGGGEGGGRGEGAGNSGGGRGDAANNADRNGGAGGAGEKKKPLYIIPRKDLEKTRRDNQSGADDDDDDYSRPNKIPRMEEELDDRGRRKKTRDDGPVVSNGGEGGTRKGDDDGEGGRRQADDGRREKKRSSPSRKKERKGRWGSPPRRRDEEAASPSRREGGRDGRREESPPSRKDGAREESAPRKDGERVGRGGDDRNNESPRDDRNGHRRGERGEDRKGEREKRDDKRDDRNDDHRGGRQDRRDEREKEKREDRNDDRRRERSPTRKEERRNYRKNDEDDDGPDRSPDKSRGRREGSRDRRSPDRGRRDDFDVDRRRGNDGRGIVIDRSAGNRRYDRDYDDDEEERNGGRLKQQQQPRQRVGPSMTSKEAATRRGDYDGDSNSEEGKKKKAKKNKKEKKEKKAKKEKKKKAKKKHRRSDSSDSD